MALEHFSTASTKEATALSEGTEVTIGGMINRVKKVITKNGRSAGMPMAIITLEDLEGQIDGTMFAETFAEVCQKYPDAVKADFEFYAVSGQLEGDPASLKVEDFWTFEVAERARKNLGQ